MDEKTRLNLQKMVKAYGAGDNTSKIRTLKHSQRIRDDVQKLVGLKDQYRELREQDKVSFEKLVLSHCGFLWKNYTNIFNRIMKDELDLNILERFLNKLKEVEDGNLDQHTASVDIGTLLKELYIDSSLKRQEKIDSTASSNEKVSRPLRDIKWAAFKKSGLLGTNLLR